MMMMTRRKLLVVAGAAAASTALTGRGWAQQTRLRGAWWGSQARTDRTLAVGRLFAEQTGIELVGEGAGWADYWPRVATQVAGGNPPDILQMELSTLGEYAERGALLPLAPYVGGALDVSDFDESQVAGGKVGGTYFAVSLGVTANGMMLNADAWQEAGVALPDAETTWDQFGQSCERVTKALNRPQFFGTQDSSGIEVAIESWLLQRDKMLYTADGQLGYSAEDVAEWFALWADFRARGACVTPDLQALDQVSIDTSMLTLGHAASSLGSANQLVGFQAVNTDTIVLAPLPRLGDDTSNGVYTKPSQFFAVTAASKNPDAAVQFINFFVRDAEAAAILGLERGVPASPEVREALSGRIDEVSQRAADYITLITPTAAPLPPAAPPGAAEINSTLKRVSEEVAFGQRTPEDGGATFVQLATEIIERA